MTSWVMRNLEHIKLQFCPKIIIGPAVCSMEPKYHGLINKLYPLQDRKLSDARYLQTRENIFRVWEIDQLYLYLGGGNFVIPMLIKLDRLLSRTTISLIGPDWILLLSIFITDSLPRDSNRYSRYFWSTDTGLISSQMVLSPEKSSFVFSSLFLSLFKCQGLAHNT